MTSLEHESNDTSVSASDYGNDNWDNENWGEMDVSDSVEFVIQFIHQMTLALNLRRHHKTQAVH